MGRVDRHDVRVLELSEGLRFAKEISGDFQSDAAAGQVLLFSQKHTAKSASTQLTHQPEIQKLAVDLRHVYQGAGQAVGCRWLGTVQRPE